MKIVKKILIFLFILIAIPLLVALFISKGFLYEKNVVVNASIEKIWEQVNSLEGMEKWSSWSKYDSEMKKENTGIDGEVGAKRTWESPHEKVGKGTQTISKIEAPQLNRNRSSIL